MLVPHHTMPLTSNELNDPPQSSQVGLRERLLSGDNNRKKNVPVADCLSQNTKMGGAGK